MLTDVIPEDIRLLRKLPVNDISGHTEAFRHLFDAENAKFQLSTSIHTSLSDIISQAAAASHSQNGEGGADADPDVHPRGPVENVVDVEGDASVVVGVGATRTLPEKWLRPNVVMTQLLSRQDRRTAGKMFANGRPCRIRCAEANYALSVHLSNF